MVAENSALLSLRNLIGVIGKDLGRYFLGLARNGQQYLTICNRNERLVAAPDRSGYRCDWQWTSDLHAPKVIRPLGHWLMKRALAEHPIRRVDSHEAQAGPAPQVTFLVGHRGMARLPHLLATLQSIAAQQGAAVECIVIEQDTVSQLGPHLPAWVRLVHTPPVDQNMPYCRAWAFNVGAHHAQSAVLILHDNDLLVPVDYAASVLDRVRQGYEVVNLKRFLFYLTPLHTDALFSGQADLLDAAPEVIMQNAEGGGSVAITRAGYDQIGGLDESFIGWGGEDNEFWERAQTLRVWPWANLPLVHLWHAAQPGKQDAGYHTARHYQALTQLAPQQRIARLTSAPNGQMRGPQGWQPATDNVNIHSGK